MLSTGTIQLKVLADTVICQGQKVQLLTTGNITDYSWAQADGPDNPVVATPGNIEEQSVLLIR